MAKTVYTSYSNVADLKIVINFHARQFQELLSGKSFCPFHETTKYVATFYWRTQRHIFLELPFLPYLVRILASCKTEQLDFRKISGFCNWSKRREARTYRLTKYYSNGQKSALFHPGGVSLVTSASYQWILRENILSHLSRKSIYTGN